MIDLPHSARRTSLYPPIIGATLLDIAGRAAGRVRQWRTLRRPSAHERLRAAVAVVSRRFRRRTGVAGDQAAVRDVRAPSAGAAARHCCSSPDRLGGDRPGL